MDSLFETLAQLTKPTFSDMKIKTVSYKDVFQLAQDKGYKISFAGEISDTGLLTIEDYLWGDEEEAKLTHSYKQLLTRSFLETCLLQTWLRDTHKIFVCVDYRQGVAEIKNFNPFDYNIFRENECRIFTTGKYKSYEEALLHGIFRAFQLI